MSHLHDHAAVATSQFGQLLELLAVQFANFLLLNEPLLHSLLLRLGERQQSEAVVDGGLIVPLRHAGQFGDDVFVLVAVARRRLVLRRRTASGPVMPGRRTHLESALAFSLTVGGSVSPLKFFRDVMSAVCTWPAVCNNMNEQRSLIRTSSDDSSGNDSKLNARTT